MLKLHSAKKEDTGVLCETAVYPKNISRMRFISYNIVVDGVHDNIRESLYDIHAFSWVSVPQSSYVHFSDEETEALKAE